MYLLIEIKIIEGGQKDVLLRMTNIKKNCTWSELEPKVVLFATDSLFKVIPLKYFPFKSVLVSTLEHNVIFELTS